MDTSLVERAQSGDQEAFGLLAVPLGDRLFAVATRILRDDDLAADATQQALVGIWRDLPQLRDPARFDAWSYRASRARLLRRAPEGAPLVTIASRAALSDRGRSLGRGGAPH